MNIWKPIALCLAAGLVASIGIQTASADRNPDPPPTLAGPCFNQINMANALNSLNSAAQSLGKAEHNKGGWRVTAINSTNAAIAATTQGCSSAN